MDQDKGSLIIERRRN